jgi:hypothetical protein
MAWGFWSASTVSDRGRSPRRLTTTNTSAIYYQTQPTPQPCTVAVNQCVQQEETFAPVPQQQQQQQQQQQARSRQQSVCGSPCQSVCHSPTCQSPSCQSGTTGKSCHPPFIEAYFTFDPDYRQIQNFS